MLQRMAKVMFFLMLLSVGALLPRVATPHCDTMDGPVIQEAQASLQKGDVTSMLKWVRPQDEQEIREAFANTQAVRRLSPEAKALADRYFFETLVRVHRAGEGAPYTGIKPAGTKVEPSIAAADSALAQGSPDKLIHMVTDEVANGIKARYNKAVETKKHANDSVAAGREYVAAYVEYVHYVEGLHTAIQGAGTHQEGEAVQHESENSAVHEHAH